MISGKLESIHNESKTRADGTGNGCVGKGYARMIDRSVLKRLAPLDPADSIQGFFKWFGNQRKGDQSVHGYLLDGLKTDAPGADIYGTCLIIEQ